MIIIAGRMILNPEKREEALDAMRTVAAATMANDAGCIQYQFYQDITDENTILLFERWDNAESLAAHSKAAHMSPFRAALKGKLADRDLYIYKDVTEEPLG